MAIKKSPVKKAAGKPAGSKSAPVKRGVTGRKKQFSSKKMLAQREAELQIINAIQMGLASQLEMQEIYELVGDKIREIFNAQNIIFGIRDWQNNLATFPYAVVNGERVQQAPFPPDVLGLYLERNCDPLLVKRSSDWRRFGLEDNRAKSFLAVQLRVGDEFKGAIAISNNEIENAFSESDVRLLSTLVNSMSIALENARLFAETQQRNAELAIINSVQQGLASKLDMQEIYELVGSKILEIFKADAIGFTVYDSNKNSLLFPYIFDHGERFYPEPVPGAKMDERFSNLTEPLIFHTHQEIQKFLAETGTANLGGQTPDNSHIFLPLRMGAQFIGSISIAKFPENAFSSSDVRLLQTLTASMSVALENARLWEQEKMYRKALQRELEIGREIQTGFLPETLPSIEGWEISASLMSAREVAGDFYDVFELPDGNIGIVIADVCDKGVGAALFMTLFRSLLRAASNLEYFEHVEQLNTSNTVADRLRRAIALTNNYIAETHGESGMFATIFFGILDPRTGKLVYINGGHEPPLILESGKVREVLHKTGPAVGALVDCHFDLLETRLNQGDILLAFTDGLPDCKNPHDEFFGRDRLLDLLHGSCDSAQKLVKLLELELHDYVAGATQFDDITLLAVQRG